jgi:hypothetical protein
MFLPSAATATAVLQVSHALVLEMYARAAHRAFPGPPGIGPTVTPPSPPAIDLEETRSVLGDEVCGLLAMLGRQRACVAPGSSRVVATRDGFAAEVVRELRRRFSLRGKAPAAREAVASLAADFLAWAAARPDEAKLLNLTSDASGQVTMTCRMLEPVLPPLEP